MKVKELINLLKDYEDFEVESIPLSLTDGTDYGFGVYKVYLNGILDIGYSDKIISLKVNYDEIYGLIDGLVLENEKLVDENNGLKEYNEELKKIINDC